MIWRFLNHSERCDAQRRKMVRVRSPPNDVFFNEATFGLLRLNRPKLPFSASDHTPASALSRL